jgi:HD superfamily phosphodiesterase
VIEPQGVYAEIFQSALPYLQVRGNVLHTRIAYDFACRLLREEEADRAVVLPAILLHDIGYSQLSSEELGKAFGPNLKDRTWQLLHERQGARLARELLEELGYAEELTEQICEIIDGHDTRLKTLGPEDSIVKDADKLFRYTTAGVEFAFTWFNLEQQAYAQLLTEQLDLWFFTRTARRIAREQIEMLAV